MRKPRLACFVAVTATALTFASMTIPTVARAQQPFAPPPSPSASSTAASPFQPPPPSLPPPPAPESTTSTAPPADPTSHGDVMLAYHAALTRRSLGNNDMTLDDVRARAAEAEELMGSGRIDDAVARLTDLVEHPKFTLFADSEDGRAAVFRLGDALATGGAYEPARAYLRRVMHSRGAWDGDATYARRAVRRLVDIALDSEDFASGEADLKDVPATAAEDTQGEVYYMDGRAREAAGDPDGALGWYSKVTQRSRFWAQATYLQGLIDVEKGRYAAGENLFCKVADPKREADTTPVFADEHYFAVRDLARLGLGRIAHEERRFDDARYYYYLVPKDSERLAEALYEAATTRYEKKDYEESRELLDELKSLGIHHPYEDEAWILDAYVDLASCKFADADKKLLGFLARYEPVRDAARRLKDDDAAMERLLAAVRTGTDAGGADVGASVAPEAMRVIAALVRLDPAYGAVVKRRAVLEREASGLRLAQGTLGDMQKSLASQGVVRPAIDLGSDPVQKAQAARAALEGLRHQIEGLVASHAQPAQIAGFQAELAALEARYAPPPDATSTGGTAAGQDLPGLLGQDSVAAADMATRVQAERAILGAEEARLAKDALARVDLRLSRLLRRARLGRIESVLGKKRGLEVEIEAIQDGYLPQDAVDSLDAARFLQDNEEYWPFEGDDWPDEFVGGEDQ